MKLIYTFKSYIFGAGILCALATALLWSCNRNEDNTAVVPKSSEKNIAYFAIKQADNKDLATDLVGVISGTIVTLSPPPNSAQSLDIKALKPYIEVSAKATVTPPSGIPQDFTNPVTYTVTAEDGKTQNYTVTLTTVKSGEKAIIAFVLKKTDNPQLPEDVSGAIDGTNISVSVPWGTNVSALKPTITTSARATGEPASAAAQDFTKPVKYTITAEDGSKQEYTVTVIVEKRSDKAIAAFVFKKDDNSRLVADVSGSISGTSISVSLPSGTNVSALKPTITISAGATIAPASGIFQNFTNPVTYGVTAEDGKTQNYTVTVILSKFFTMTWRTESADESITLPLVNNGAYNFTVNWGDNTSNAITTWDDANKTHRYAARGDYTVIIAGILQGWMFGGDIDWSKPPAYYANAEAEKLIEIKDWGEMAFGETEAQFAGAKNLTITAADSPDLSETKSLRGCFFYAPDFNSDISAWNTANVTNMSAMFRNASSFNQPIGDWNTAKVANMSEMFFFASSFNQPIGNWNTRRVTDMSSMFSFASAFNQSIGNWNTANVTDMSLMFSWARAFNQPIGNWNTANVTNMSQMFSIADAFNQSIGNWSTANVTNMSQMFSSASAFNQPIGTWNTANVTDMSEMFFFARAFDQAIGNWNTANVTNMSQMFYNASTFNQPIGTWNTAKVTNMSQMFYNASTFNQPVGTWNTAKATNMSQMFYNASTFNQPIGTWNTANVTDMSKMFQYAYAFNQPIGTWNTANVTNMSQMFYNARDFNQPIGNWSTANVTNMERMFSDARTFNQPLGAWNTAKVTDMAYMFHRAWAFNQDLSRWSVGAVTECGDFSLYATAWTAAKKPRFTKCSE